LAKTKDTLVGIPKAPFKSVPMLPELLVPLPKFITRLVLEKVVAAVSPMNSWQVEVVMAPVGAKVPPSVCARAPVGWAPAMTQSSHHRRSAFVLNICFMYLSF
jgi:hypothetical protein